MRGGNLVYLTDGSCVRMCDQCDKMFDCFNKDGFLSHLLVKHGGAAGGGRPGNRKEPTFFHTCEKFQGMRLICLGVVECDLSRASTAALTEFLVRMLSIAGLLSSVISTLSALLH